MKSAWRNCTRLASSPAAAPGCSAASAASTARVTPMVSAPGCFWTLKITAGPP